MEASSSGLWISEMLPVKWEEGGPVVLLHVLQHRHASPWSPMLWRAGKWSRRVSEGGTDGTAGATVKATYLGPCIETVLDFQPTVAVWLRDLKLDDCGWWLHVKGGELSSHVKRLTGRVCFAQ